MARRRQKTSIFQDLIDITSRLPWWISCLLAVISSIILHHIAGTKPPKPAGLGNMGSAVGQQIGITFAAFGQFILPAVFGIGALISLIKTLSQPKPKSRYEDYEAEIKAAPRRLRVRPEGSLREPLPSHSVDQKHLPAEEFIIFPPQPAVPQEWTPLLLSSLEWKRFETVCAEYFRLIGYESRETRIGADGGVDIRINKPWEEGSDTIIQCKAWSTYNVGVKPLRELYGVMAAEGVPQGMFMTSGEFTREAVDFAKGKNLTLYSGTRLLAEICKLPEQWQQALLVVALEGDYTTPTCPQCGVKMTLRSGKGGQRNFWGCPRYPRCKSTLSYKGEQQYGLSSGDTTLNSPSI
jgi:restriction system protein